MGAENLTWISDIMMSFYCYSNYQKEYRIFVFYLNHSKLLLTVFMASLVTQWLRIHLPMQGTRVRALVREDPTCHGATKTVHHNYWACVPQLLKPERLEPMLCNKRSHHNEKPLWSSYFILRHFIHDFQVKLSTLAV